MMPQQTGAKLGKRLPSPFPSVVRSKGFLQTQGRRHGRAPLRRSRALVCPAPPDGGAVYRCPSASGNGGSCQARGFLKARPEQVVQLLALLRKHAETVWQRGAFKLQTPRAQDERVDTLRFSGRACLRALELDDGLMQEEGRWMCGAALLDDDYVDGIYFMLMCCDEVTLWHTDIISRLGSGDGCGGLCTNTSRMREREREPSLSKGSEREEKGESIYMREHANVRGLRGSVASRFET